MDADEVMSEYTVCVLDVEVAVVMGIDREETLELEFALALNDVAKAEDAAIFVDCDCEDDPTRLVICEIVETEDTAEELNNAAREL